MIGVGGSYAKRHTVSGAAWIRLWCLEPGVFFLLSQLQVPEKFLCQTPSQEFVRHQGLLRHCIPKRLMNWSVFHPLFFESCGMVSDCLSNVGTRATWACYFKNHFTLEHKESALSNEISGSANSLWQNKTMNLGENSSVCAWSLHSRFLYSTDIINCAPLFRQADRGLFAQGHVKWFVFSRLPSMTFLCVSSFEI